MTSKEVLSQIKRRIDLKEIVPPTIKVKDINQLIVDLLDDLECEEEITLDDDINDLILKLEKRIYEDYLSE